MILWLSGLLAQHAARLEVLLRRVQQAAQRRHAADGGRRPEGLQLSRQLDGAGRLCATLGLGLGLGLGSGLGLIN